MILPGKKEKLLLISPQPFFQWRGSPIRVSFDALALAQLGFDVDLLTLPIGENKEIPGVRIIRVPNLFFIRNIPIGPSPAKALFDLLLLIKGLKIAFLNKYRFIHCIEDAGIIGLIICKLTGAKLIFEKHSDPLSYNKGKLRNFIMRLYAGIEAFVARHADAVIGTGTGLTEQIQAMNPTGSVHHIFDIPSSLVEPDANRAEKRRESLKLKPNEILITYAGSFAVYQGIEILFAAIPDVVKKHPEARFIIIGGSENEIFERRKSLVMRGAEMNVTFLGKVPPDELPDILSASDILLSPRISGVNTPLKLLDYLKAGRAILATDTKANRLIIDDTTAVMVKPDPTAFEQGIHKLITEPELREKLGKKGKTLIIERYNFNEFKKRIQACYAPLNADSA